ncbi:phosphomannomutase [Pseudoalteromonas sp. 10-33]|uniref:phosphomannomutase n=1 Tax=Pseudoalteromonas sp. 10-33 TaxID=1761890 RepID=UPI000731F966|nr:phosphomannomutase [Pseudoalteromonas sp. 10-33]KTF18938.1 phosphomannomutase [Pseudoalteromonas sp. 10-33]
MDSSVIIEQSGIEFGTSGARGLVSDFTIEVCAAFAIAFASVLKKEQDLKTIAVAIDNRPSSYKMAQAISVGLKQLDIETKFYGVIPTPALAFHSMQQEMPCIMVTGSHIPFDRNGLKFYRSGGEITKADETAILKIKAPVLPIPLELLPELKILLDAKQIYITRNTEAFDKKTLSGKRIGIYEHSSAGRDLYGEIFENLGAEVVTLGRSDSFVPIDTEAVSDADKQKAKDWVKEYKLDALFSTDGDGDRPLLSDENGEWLRGDILGLLCSKILKIEALATPVSCNTAIEKSGLFKHIERTKIGSPYVIAGLEVLCKKYSVVAGFEANGGYLLASEVTLNGKIIKPLPTRDAILPAIILLSQLNVTSISEMVNSLPSRFASSDRIKDYAIHKSLDLIRDIAQHPERLLPGLGFEADVIDMDETDGLRISFVDGTIVHLRPSGNAPELRCYAEASTVAKADNLVLNTLTRIEEL